MLAVKFSWDADKDRENQRKHGVSFEEASTVFSSFPFDVFYDPDHSEDEDRYVAVGFSNQQRILLVVHCENHSGTEIRIISARKATKREQRTLWGDTK